RLKPELPRAAVARARAALQSAEARLELASAELRRQQNLKGQGVASDSEFDRTQSEARTAEASVAEARASLLDAETRLAKTEIRAPFSGVVGVIDLEPGAYVRAGDPVAELADLTEIEVSVGVGDQEVLAIQAGDAVVLRVDALGGRAFEGRVQRPGRTPDSTTRKYPVPIRVPNPEGELLPGMLGTVTFSLGEPRSVLRIPRRAVQREFDLEYLYVLDGADSAGTRVERRRVRTEPVPFRPELLEIREGLDVGERIAVSSLRDLRGGELVRTRELAPVSSELAAEEAPTP
nr:efflux RND transporter periplasmic adaptor subunit [Myxococcota bacterium]